MNLNIIKIDRYGFYLFGYRFANETLLKKIKETYPKRTHPYKEYNLFGFTIFKKK